MARLELAISNLEGLRIIHCATPADGNKRGVEPITPAIVEAML